MANTAGLAEQEATALMELSVQQVLHTLVRSVIAIQLEALFAEQVTTHLSPLTPDTT